MINVSNDIELYLNKKKAKSIILAISGGVDSVVLLNVFNNLLNRKKEISLALCYINYNTSNYSSRSYDLCKNYASAYKLPFYSTSVKLSNNNFESKARLIRYDFLNKIINKIKYDLIVTAHHYNDQLETLIMKDEDKADWVSFIGIRQEYSKIYRPLLNTSKDTIYLYAKEKNLTWIEDPTNKNSKFRRNNIRKKIATQCYKRRYIDNLFKKHFNSINKMKDFQILYDNLFKNHASLSNYMSVEINFDILNIVSNHIYLKLIFSKYVSFFLGIKNLSCTKHHWLSLSKFMLTANQGKIFKLTDSLFLLKDRTHFILYENIELDNNYKLKITDKLSNWYNTSFLLKRNSSHNIKDVCIKIDKKQLDNGLYLTHWRNGDSIKHNKFKKKISDLFIDNKISNFNKKFYPILRNNKDEILWVPKLSKADDSYSDKSYYLIWES